MSKLSTPPSNVSPPKNPSNLGVLAEASVSLSWSTVLGSRLSDYLELTKARIAVMVLISVSVGFALASGNSVQLPLLGHALFGIAMVAASSSALNQYLERRTDCLMPRTADRPLPSGRLLVMEVVTFGLLSGVMGVFYLACFVNWQTALLTGSTLLIYVFVYTPLKRSTSLCTAVGAIPGALPPVLGWTAAGGALNTEVLSLFGILFLWQFPHFLAIGWLYREQYHRAGLKMLPFEHWNVTGFLAVGYALVLLPVSLLPSLCGLAGDTYFLTAVILGLGYLLCAVRFMQWECSRTARGLLWSSLLYLPVLLFALTWDHFRLL
ncbi:MAG: heme o synthase, partial [Planctomycetaceae bacterium]|nr:heme o synthase [Planctomycetaceae bacterium]